MKAVAYRTAAEMLKTTSWGVGVGRERRTSLGGVLQKLSLVNSYHRVISVRVNPASQLGLGDRGGYASRGTPCGPKQRNISTFWASCPRDGQGKGQMCLSHHPQLNCPVLTVVVN